MSAKDTTYESKVMSTLYNPFSLKNMDPKWPDGLCTSSTGVQLKKTSELRGSEMVIVLLPGLVNWCFAYTWDELDDKWILTMNHCDNMYILSVLENKIIGTTNQQAVGAQTDPEDLAQDEISYPNFSSWRGVSYGMRLMNINSDHDNDGWFECIRTSRSVFLNRLGLTAYKFGANGFDIAVDEEPWASYGNREKDNIYLKGGCVFPLNATAQEWFSARNWAIMPSYASGKLKELRDFVFQLNPEKKHNDFTKIEFSPYYLYESLTTKYAKNEEIYMIYHNLDVTTGVDLPVAQIDNNFRVLGMTTENQDTQAGVGFEKWQDFHKGFTSDNFDIILLKIHGLENTRTVVSSVCNLEFQLNERTNIGHHHHTNSYACSQSLDKYLEYRTTYGRSPFQDTSKKRN
jgi:hypothetical protein